MVGNRIEDNYKDAFCEVIEIIEHMPFNLKDKISIQFINFLKENKNYNYNFKIDKEVSLSNQNLKKETKILLSLIYRSYLCSEEEKNELYNKDKIEMQEKEEERKRKYNPDNIFPKSEINDNKENSEIIMKNSITVIEKENFIIKVLKKILSKFNIK